MLVKKSIVENWFKRTSLVYKGFEYWFKNPLWQKSVPQGFTVCPYFWMSMTSWLFRFLVVWPIVFIIRPIIKRCGAPARAIDKLLYNVLSACGITTVSEYREGAGGITALLAAIATLVVGFLGVVAYHQVTHIIYPAAETLKGGLFLFWSVASLLGIVGVILLHRKWWKTSCKPQYYLILWALYFLGGLLFNYHAEIWQGLSGAGVQIWGALVSVVTHLASWIGIGIKWIGISLWYLLTFSPTQLWFPWWGYVAIFNGLGWVMGRWSDSRRCPNTQGVSLVDTQAANRRGWVSLFTRIVDTDDWGSTLFTDSSEIHEAAIKRFKSSMAYGAVNVHRQEILRRAIETYFKTELDTLQSEYPIVRRDIRERLKKADSIYDSFQRLSQFAENTTASFDFDRSKFIDSVTDTITNNMEIYGWVSDTIANMQQREQQKYERRKARAESWSTKWCLATTTWIAETSANSWETLCNAVSCVYGGIKTFFAYLWMLAKAKKQGACPYIRFTDEKH